MILRSPPLGCVCLVSLTMGVGGLSCFAPRHGAAMSTPVNQVDHVVALSAEPGSLHAFFTETLGLPVAWPFMNYPGFASGGVFLGNVNLELLSFGSQGPFPPPAEGAKLFGIVYEPRPLTEITTDLRLRGLAPGVPQVQRGGPPGQETTLWTSVFLEALCTSDQVVYLCEYSPGYLQRLRERTADLVPPFGGLGLRRVKEVVVCTRDEGLRGVLWDAFLAPLVAQGGSYALGKGPAVRLVRGEEDRILRLVLEVDSLERARSFLEAKGVLGQAAPGELRVALSAVQNLEICLVQG